ncbi:AMP-binding protein [Larkinella sp. GY13]|uniref:AMP-binding protein n=1 Tax=Larkinella sp. GY13 TaxID=3453720 RepID=UPI003EE83D84
MNDEFRLRWTEIAQRYSTKAAFCEGNRTITYEMLFHRAHQYADALLVRNFRQQCIPVLLDDPLEHVAALIGVLLSGNYYHSVHPQPVESLGDVVQSRACPGLISRLPLVVPNHPGLPTLLPETLPTDRLAPQSCPIVSPETPFCLFMTSGSTGQPKQVIHSHASVLADTFRQIIDNEITATDRIDLLFSLEFSASLACIFPALLTGATLVFYDLKKEGVLSLPVFWQQQKITFSSLSVSTFRLLLKTDTDFRALSGLRILSIGAEPIQSSDITGFQKRFSTHTTLQVAYATTETRTISDYKLRTDTPVTDHLFSVGKPVSGRTVWIRSETGAPLPHNQVGEIIVQALSIPSDYPNNRDATQRAYQRLPDGMIAYATGDLGFLDADGYLFWCGRTDFVVKINGQKVSLIQIEQELKSGRGVKNAAVLYDTSHENRFILKAFLCTEPDFDLAGLRQFLAQRLPVIMLPDRYILLDTLPLTKTGKIDRLRLAALPEPESQLSDHPLADEADAWDFVPLIKSVWQKELGLTTALSDYDDFFQDLGGDSLMAESCLAGLENRIGKTVPVQAVFSYTTPKALAHYLTGYARHQVQCIPLNKPERNRKHVYFIPPLPGDRRMYRGIESHLNQHCNVYYVHYEPYTTNGTLIPLADLVEQIARAIDRPADSLLIGFSFGGLVAYQVALALEQRQQPTLNRLVLLDTPLYRRITFRESLRKDVHRIGRKVVAGFKAERPVDWNASWQRAVARYRNRLTSRTTRADGGTQAVNWQEPSFAAVDQYARQAEVKIPVACPIVLFRASDSSAFQYEIRPDFRWQLFAKTGFEEHWLEANHDQVLNSVHSYRIGTIVNGYLHS